jgi:hypothetical protein
MGGGLGFGSVWRGKWRRGPAQSEGGSVTWDGMTRTRWLRAAPTAAGGARCAMRDEMAERWGQATSGPGGSGRGAGGSASERGRVAQGADRRAQ